MSRGSRGRRGIEKSHEVVKELLRGKRQTEIRRMGCGEKHGRLVVFTSVDRGGWLCVSGGCEDEEGAGKRARYHIQKENPF